MPHLNIEIKAHCREPDRIRRILQEHKARFAGQDHQIDTYFKVEKGRLKLREGQIERALIHYHRPDQAGPKASLVTLYQTQAGDGLKTILEKALGVWRIVDKLREIYFIDNVKFHLDKVEGLGSFVEIEAIDADHSLGEAHLRRQCDHFINLFKIGETDLVEVSYSDLMKE